MDAIDVKQALTDLTASIDKQLRQFMATTGHVPEVNIYLNEYGDGADMLFVPEVTITAYVK